MKIAIDTSPIDDQGLVSHRVRGVGSYINNLKRSLIRYYPYNKYTFFTRKQKLPKDVDLVHYPYFEPFFLTLPFFNKTPFVVTVHDLTPLVFPKCFPKGARGSFKWFIQKSLLRKANLIISDSLSSKKDIIKHTGIPATKIHVIYLSASENFKPLNDTLLLRRIRVKYELPEKFVLYVGDVTWNKNLPNLIRAIKKTNLSLVMAGKALTEKNFDKNNPWNKDLVEVRKMIENDNKIKTLGFVPTDDLVALYNMAEVFVMPSLYEGFGLPILEAMACGCPVITTKEGSIPEVAGDSVFYVDAYNEGSIANGIKEVFANSNLQKKLSDKGLTQSNKFSWKKTAEKTVKAYEKVLENR